MIDDNTVTRFWSSVSVGKTPDDCWAWNKSKNKGYGQLSRGRGMSPYKAHRLSWEIHNGEIPDGLEVCHRCDNPECTNPLHLFVGTHRDNMVDAQNKGRLAYYNHGLGEDNNVATLTNDEVRALRSDYCSGEFTYEQLSRKYNTTNVDRILANRVYVDDGFSPVNGNAKPRPSRRMFIKEEAEEIASAHSRIGSSRQTARLFGTNKTTVMKIVKGLYKCRIKN